MVNLDRMLSGQHLVNIGNCKEEFMAKLEDKTTEDMVNHPPHYNKAGIETIEAIKAMTDGGFEYYLQGNIMKYLWRYRYKNGVEDLKKAQWYLEELVNVVESNES